MKRHAFDEGHRQVPSSVSRVPLRRFIGTHSSRTCSPLLEGPVLRVTSKWLLFRRFRVRLQQRDDFNENGYSFANILLESVHTALLERGR